MKKEKSLNVELIYSSDKNTAWCYISNFNPFQLRCKENVSKSVKNLFVMNWHDNQTISFFFSTIFKRAKSSPTLIYVTVIQPTLSCQQYADLSPLFVLVELMLMFAVHLSVGFISYAVKIIKYGVKFSRRTRFWDKQKFVQRFVSWV